MRKPEYKIALRPDSDGQLDDVVVRDVSMFRLERMGDGEWWGCCYFADVRERVNFWLYVDRGGRLNVVVNEPLPKGFTVEPGSIQPLQ